VSPLPSHLAKLAKLRVDVADRVLERAAIIQEACGVPWPEADRLALEQEGSAQRSLFGGGT
jgi:hypothetical protein